MNENPNCQLCLLHASVNPRSVCLKGGGGDKPKLVIFLDAPNVVEDKRSRGVVSDGVEWLKWCFRRMTISRDDIYIDYVLKCYTGRSKEFKTKALRAEMVEQCSVYRVATLQQLKPNAIVAMGRFACEALTGRSDKVKESEGTKWIATEPFVRKYVSHVWVTYSPLYPLQAAAESVGIFRVLWCAAIEAGLKPKINKTVTPFDYGT